MKKNDVPLYDKADGKELFKAPKFTPLMGTGKKDSRYVEVQDSSGKTLWAKRSTLTTGYSCLIVRVDKSRLREGPGANYPAAKISEKGMVFKDHGGEDGWTQVENIQGEKSWINLDHAWKPRSKLRMSFEPQ